MSSERTAGRKLFEAAMQKRGRELRETFREAIARPISESLAREKRMIAENLFVGEACDYRTPPGDWDDDPERIEEDEGFDDRPFSMDRLKRARHGWDDDPERGEEDEDFDDRPFSMDRLRRARRNRYDEDREKSYDDTGE